MERGSRRAAEALSFAKAVRARSPLTSAAGGPLFLFSCCILKGTFAPQLSHSVRVQGGSWRCWGGLAGAAAHGWGQPHAEGTGRLLSLCVWEEGQEGGWGGPGLMPRPPCPAPGAVADLTLLADLRLTDPQRFFLTCVSGEARGADAWGPPLLLEKDDRIVRTPRPWQPLHLARNGSHRLTLRGFSQPSDLVGVFSCVGGAGARRTRVVYVHNSPGGSWR